MKKITVLIASIILLTSCQKNAFTNIAKTDIDIITELHVLNANEYVEELVIKLYKLK